MAEVAEELVPLVERSNARLVAVGGDEPAVGLLLDDLPAAVRPLVHPIAVTRAEDGSFARLDAELDQLVTQWVDDQLHTTLAVHEREAGQHDRATSGAAETLAALRMASVAVLIVPADPAPAGGDGSDAAPAWIGDGATDVALSADDLTDPGAAEPVPLVDAAVGAALATGADVRVIPDRLDARLADLAAILRW